MSGPKTKVAVSTKGHIIDQHCKYNSGTIVEANGFVYDCTLNQTEIGSNKNKFYIMQVIKHNKGTCCYIRFGRIGIVGRIEHKEFSTDKMAISFFENQFKSKTGNDWFNKDNFVKKDKKYFMSEIEGADVLESSSGENDSSGSGSENTDDSDNSDPGSKLDSRLVSFLKLISNTNYMKNTLIELEIDTEKMPLGKISQAQIDKAYDILYKINKNIGKNDDKKFLQLSSDFYTLIPYACGRQQPPVIQTQKLVGKYINLLNELTQIVSGTKAIVKLKKDKGDLNKFYNDLSTEIVPLGKNNDMYNILANYLKNSKAPTHNFSYEILNIFEVNRENERETYEDFSKNLKNKTLLFHGTRCCNLIGIFKNGMLCDPSKLGINVCVTGKMFGMGLYFANSASKSIQYCAYDSSDNIACLFVVEAALGKMLEKKSADVSLTAKTLPKGYNSTWGVGKSSFKEYDEYDEIRIPKGTLKSVSNNANSSLLYDEFIIYHDEQVNLRYIIQLKID
ncbi:MAG: poly(ADP-ribose) polymerase [Satyrvirus sp.]|uniref:NAD(+) ADP-ribosyltransferase n=1 Tax=Satyrvirus sp. TaxID=2487771 RepID=A0A3G5AD38_9VIRU|nr:MAG: poly(ADP-ribose) polymerase [Satyrvirus sp.]